MVKTIDIFIEGYDFYVPFPIDKFEDDDLSKLQVKILKDVLKDEEELIKYHIFNTKMERYLLSFKDIRQFGFYLTRK